MIKYDQPPKVKLRGRYSPSETARLLGIGRTTLYEYTKQQKIFFRYNVILKRRFYTGMEIKRFWLQYGLIEQKPFLCYRYGIPRYCLYKRKKKRYKVPTIALLSARELALKLAR